METYGADGHTTFECGVEWTYLVKQLNLAPKENVLSLYATIAAYKKNFSEDDLISIRCALSEVSPDKNDCIFSIRDDLGLKINADGTIPFKSRFKAVFVFDSGIFLQKFGFDNLKTELLRITSEFGYIVFIKKMNRWGNEISYPNIFKGMEDLHGTPKNVIVRHTGQLGFKNTFSVFEKNTYF